MLTKAMKTIICHMLNLQDIDLASVVGGLECVGAFDLHRTLTDRHHMSDTQLLEHACIHGMEHSAEVKERQNPRRKTAIKVGGLDPHRACRARRERR